jgi:hypothetical protein
MRLTTIFVFLFVSLLNAQHKYNLNVGKIKERAYHTTFDFKDINGKIIIDVKINNKIRKFILDTGAPTSISSALASEMNCKKIISNTISDFNSKEGEVDMIQIPEFSINGLTFLDSYAVKLNDMSIFKCFNVEGVIVEGFIGSNSLRNSVVEFDFKAKKITISSNIKSFGYGTIKPNDLFFMDSQSSPLLKIKLGLGHLSGTDEVLFDSGDPSFYSITKSNLDQIFTMIKEKQLPNELQNINQSDLLGIIASSNGSFSWGLFGNETANDHYMFKIQDLNFGTSIFDNIIATTTYGSKPRIGSEILEYGKLTLDYKNQKYYFQQYEDQKEINVNHRFKSINPSFENDKFVVGIVWDEKIKDRVCVGDEILSVNTIDFSVLTKCQIMTMSFDDFKDEDKLVLKLKDKVTHKIKVVEIQN